jgi:hypothetical protein
MNLADNARQIMVRTFSLSFFAPLRLGVRLNFSPNRKGAKKDKRQFDHEV